jgi:integrase
MLKDADAAEFALLTGIRRGEQWALEWEDCRPDCIWVEPAKTGKGRWVYLNGRAREILAARREQGLPRPFPSAGPAGLARHFNRTCKRRGLAIRWHGLRHSCATRLMRARVAPRVVQRILGWSSLTMVEHYSHVADDQMREAMDLLCR